MVIKFDDILQIIGCTSQDMNKIAIALNGGSNSIRAKMLNGEIDFNEYYEYSDKIALMIEKLNNHNISMHAYLLNEKGRPHTHYVISSPNQESAWLVRRPAHDNTRFAGKVLQEKEEQENSPLATIHIYDTTMTSNILRSNGKLIGEAKYSLVNVNGKYYVHLVYVTANPQKTKDGKKVSKYSTYFPVPKSIVQKMTSQKPFAVEILDELQKETGSDLSEEFKRSLMKNIEKMMKEFDEGKDDTDDNFLKR